MRATLLAITFLTLLAPLAFALTPPLMPGDDVIVRVPSSQNEMSIAADPLDPDHLIAGANDYSPGDAWAGVFVTHDGGASWSHGLIPLPSIYTASGDPALAFGPDGTAYYAGIAFNRGNTNNGANAIFVSRSLDGGATWSTVTPFTSPDGAVFHDKVYIATDPASGDVLLTYTHFGAGGGISFSKSTDHGLTFTPRKVIGGGQFSQPVAGVNGEIFVTWSSGGRVAFSRSEDGGATFTTTTLFSTETGSIPVGFRYSAYPSMDVARGGPNAGRIWLSAPRLNAATEDVQVFTSDDSGRTWSAGDVLARPGAQFMQWLAVAPDGTVGVSFMDTVLSPASYASVSTGYANPATLLSQSLSVKRPGDPAWTTTLLTDVPSAASASGFWGDYQGLAATSIGFHPAFADARNVPNCSACPSTDGLDFATMRVPLSLVS